MIQPEVSSRERRGESVALRRSLLGQSVGYRGRERGKRDERGVAQSENESRTAPQGGGSEASGARGVQGVGVNRDVGPERQPQALSDLRDYLLG